MVTRRKLLSGIALGALATGLGVRPTGALTVEAMPNPVAKIMALACRPNSVADHAALIGGTQAALRREIVAGSLPANARQIVVCPICGCKFTVTADSSS